MRKKRRTKIFAKAFRFVNADGTFTKEDFELLKEKFEIIRKVYFDEKENHDYYDGFRAITKEVKRAAHNAGLQGEIAKLEYQSSATKFTCINETERDVEFNLIVTIKGAAKYSRENHFVVTGIIGLETPRLLKGNILGGAYDSISYGVTDDLADEENPTYLFIEGE